MKNLHKIVLLLLTFVFLSTYTPNQQRILNKEKKIFFQIKNIKIENNNLIDKNTIIKKLDKIFKKNIFFLKKSDLEKPLQSINFLEKIEVKKKYPNTIELKVFETKPLAVLFKKNEKYLIDSSSNLILFKEIISNDEFPTIFGEDGEKNFISFYKKLKSNNFPLQSIKNYYFFQIGRWDVEFFNNKLIKFPENNGEEIIRQSIKLLNRNDFKNYNVIDLRINGKVIVE